MAIAYIMYRVEEIFKKQEEILVTLKDIQTRIQKLEHQLSSSKRNTEGMLLPSFGTELLLHHKGKTKIVQRPLTDEEKMINLIKTVSKK